MEYKEKVDMERIRELKEEGVNGVKVRKVGYDEDDFEDDDID